MAHPDRRIEIRRKLLEAAAPETVAEVRSHLLKFGGIDAFDPETGSTILTRALSQWDNYASSRMLAALGLGASVDLRDARGVNFFGSLRLWRERVPEQALQLTENPSQIDSYGETALFHAVQFGDGQAFDLYLRHGVDPLVRSKACSLLEFSAARSHACLVSKLLALPLADWTDDELARSVALVGSARRGSMTLPSDSDACIQALRGAIAERESAEIFAFSFGAETDRGASDGDGSLASSPIRKARSASL